MIFCASLLLALTIQNGITAQCDSEQKSSTVYLYSHGIGDCHKQAYIYTKNKDLASQHKLEGINERYLIDGPVITFDYPDATHAIKKVKRKKIYFGQDRDLTYLATAYDNAYNWSLENSQSQPELVIFAMSRGASAALNFVALNNPDGIRALVLESPYDTVESILKSLLSRFYIDWVPGVLNISSTIMKQLFTGYDPEGISPLKIVKNIPLDLPILLICSKKDKVVSAASTARIYKVLREMGHNTVHILILDHGAHSRLFAQEDGEIYQNVTHAFFSHYGLPHDPVLAKSGQERFELCQPTREELRRLLK